MMDTLIDCDAAAFDRWWYEEGSGIAPEEGEEPESHACRVARIAWLNGAYCARHHAKVTGEVE
jgi:hypothetical protein